MVQCYILSGARKAVSCVLDHIVIVFDLFLAQDCCCRLCQEALQDLHTSDLQLCLGDI